MIGPIPVNAMPVSVITDQATYTTISAPLHGRSDADVPLEQKIISKTLNLDPQRRMFWR